MERDLNKLARRESILERLETSLHLPRERTRASPGVFAAQSQGGKTEGTSQGETQKLRGREHNVRSEIWNGQTSSASWQCGLTRKSSGAAEIVACTSSSICVHPVHPR